MTVARHHANAQNGSSQWNICSEVFSRLRQKCSEKQKFICLMSPVTFSTLEIRSVRTGKSGLFSEGQTFLLRSESGKLGNSNLEIQKKKKPKNKKKKAIVPKNFLRS